MIDIVKKQPDRFPVDNSLGMVENISFRGESLADEACSRIFQT